VGVAQGARDVGPGRGGGGDALRGGWAGQQTGIRPYSPGEVRSRPCFLPLHRRIYSSANIPSPDFYQSDKYTELCCELASLQNLGLPICFP
jgi:hypothetical protein